MKQNNENKNIDMSVQGQRLEQEEYMENTSKDNQNETDYDNQEELEIKKKIEQIENEYKLHNNKNRPININDQNTGNKISGNFINNKIDGILYIEANGYNLNISFNNGIINGKVSIGEKEYVNMKNGTLNGEAIIANMKLYFEDGKLKKKELL